jgi:hypothetical protein
VCDLETSRICTPYIYDISHLKVKVLREKCDNNSRTEMRVRNTLVSQKEHAVRSSER